MGFPPPTPGPPPDPPGFVSADAGFAPSPTAADLCGFKFPPGVFFKFGFNLPGFALQFPPPLPKFSFSLAINCDLDNPLSVSAGLSWGGGRKSNAGPDPDALEQGR